MTPIYRVRNWHKSHENAQSRKVQSCRWVSVPNKHDGKSFRRLIAMPNGLALYGAWILILAVASKCPRRGVLADEDGPLSPDDLALKTGSPSDVFREAFEVLADPKIGWLETVPSDELSGEMVADWEHAPTTLPDHPARAALKGREGEGTESNRKEDPPPPPSLKRSSIADEWGKVEGVFRECGITQLRNAITSAKTSGAPPAEFIALADHYRSNPNLGNPGALYNRVLNHTPGSDLAEGWPTTKSKITSSPYLQPYKPDKKPKSPPSAAWIAAKAKLDALSEADVQTLAEGVFAANPVQLAQFRKRGRNAGTVEPALIRALMSEMKAAG